MTGMTDEVIVGYDGSPGSELALNWAAREARKRGGRLTVCHAWAPGDLALPAGPAAFDVPRWHGEEIVNRGLQRAQAIAGPEGVQPLLVLGSPARVLCEHSGTATMVVVGARGDGGLAGLLLGSVAWQLAGHGQGRVVIVRGSGRPANAAPGPVVAGVDGSSASRAVLAFAAEEAALRHVPLIAACALADAPGRIGGAGRLEEEFSSLVTRWEKEHPGVPVLRQVTHGTPRAALLDAAAEAQVLIVGSRGRGGIRGMTLGSVATVLAHHAPCPVGIVRPPAALSAGFTEARPGLAAGGGPACHPRPRHVLSIRKVHDGGASMRDTERGPAPLEQLRAQRGRLADRMRPPWWHLPGVAIMWALFFAGPFTSRSFSSPASVSTWAIVVPAAAVCCLLQWGMTRATGIKAGSRPLRILKDGLFYYRPGRPAGIAIVAVSLAGLAIEGSLIRHGLPAAAIVVAALAVAAEVTAQRALLRAIRQDLRGGAGPA